MITRKRREIQFELPTIYATNLGSQKSQKPRKANATKIVILSRVRKSLTASNRRAKSQRSTCHTWVPTIRHSTYRAAEGAHLARSALCCTCLSPLSSWACAVDPALGWPKNRIGELRANVRTSSSAEADEVPAWRRAGALIYLSAGHGGGSVSLPLFGATARVPSPIRPGACSHFHYTCCCCCCPLPLSLSGAPMGAYAHASPRDYSCARGDISNRRGGRNSRRACGSAERTREWVALAS